MIFFLVIGVMKEQRVAIKFCVKAGKSAVETIELINKAYGSAAMSRAIVYRWYAYGSAAMSRAIVYH
jgi:hypothetical protein